MKNSQYTNISINCQHAYEFSPYVFGHNLEHTRGSITGGLSAQMLRNRKFAGYPSRNEGCPAEWFSIGSGHVLYDSFPRKPWLDQSMTYTRHWDRMFGCGRIHEVQSLIIQNLSEGEICGIGQQGISVQAQGKYEFKAIAKCDKPVVLTVSLTDRDWMKVYAEENISFCPGDWQTEECTLLADCQDENACLRITFSKHAKVILGVVSLLPEDTFLGMRPDVIEHLKKIGVSMLRWPGGNFAGDYLWKDGLLPVDERAPLQAYRMGTLPYGRGYDGHEIGIDEFIALCREIGAEPSITINPVWQTPEENAAWVEYCNGSAETEYGAMRIQRGHEEPYNVKYWGLGNELGHGHMEGPNTPQKYAELVRMHAEAMLQVSPDLELCSTGPYPSKEWVENSANMLADIVKHVSVHWYFNIYHEQWDYSTPELAKKTAKWIIDGTGDFLSRIKEMRKDLDKDIHIAFDEWNVWRAWYRPASTAEGIFAGRMIHMFMEESVRSDMPVCCYFEPIGEGAIEVKPDVCTVTAMGQMFTLMKSHLGGKICPTEGTENVDVMATLCEGIVTVTLLNMDVEKAQTCCLELSGDVISADALVADSLLPHSRFRGAEVDVRTENDGIAVEIPPCSAVKLCIRVK